MAAQTRATNKGVYETGDNPVGSNYVDLIDSFLSLLDTTAQTVTSDITLSGGANATRIGIGTATPTSFRLHVVDSAEGNLALDIPTTTRASGGTNGAVPASAASFALVRVNGTIYRIALFNN